MSDAFQPQPDPAATEPLLFGEIAIELGLLDAAQLQQALEAQRQQLAAKPPPAQPQRLGEILVEQHRLELRAVQKILLIQKRRHVKLGVASSPPVNQFGPYEIMSVIGQGGMGLVYKARDPRADRVVALKVLSLRLTDEAEFLARFKREVETARSLSHPNIVAAFDSGADDNGQPFLAMEFIDGSSLGRLLQNDGALPEKRALEIARDIAAALDHAHARGIVHRDVKPDNVMLGAAGGAVKLTDFGLAKLLRQEQQLTQSGIAIGTPHYISPEQVEASRYIDHRADLYSLGAMLFHMLTGKVPFDGASNNDIMLMHLHERLRDPRDLNPRVSSAAANIVKKLMSKKTADRYESAAQVLEDIQLVLNSGKPRHAISLTLEKPLETGRGCMVLLMLAMTGMLLLAIWSPWR